MSVKAAVVIPVYKAEISDLEKISLTQCRKVLGNYPLIFVAPEGANFPYFAAGDKVAHFPPQFFQNTQTYSALMMSPFFYDAFKDYDYILIYQLDAFVFRDELEYFCSLGYDYIGAPWASPIRKSSDRGKKLRLRVGNGGFCLKNVKAHYELLLNHSDLVNQCLNRKMPDDVFFSYCGGRDDCNFSVAPLNVAYKFAAEFNPTRVVKKNGGKLPFGCHAWHKYSADFYIPLFMKYGYDLRPLKDKMRIVPNELILYGFFLKETKRRLARRIKRGQSLMRYLPTNHFASVRAVRHPDAIMILMRLIWEDNSLADKIFLYDTEEDLINDLTREDLPHLLLTKDYEPTSLIKALNKRELSYGKYVVSFWREYLTYCAKLFRNLGK